MAQFDIPQSPPFPDEYGDITTHPYVVTEFSDVLGPSGWTSDATLQTQYDSLIFSDLIGFGDLHLANAGNGTLRVTLTQAGTQVAQFDISDFEDGLAITGFPFVLSQNAVENESDYTVVEATSSGVDASFVVRRDVSTTSAFIDVAPVSTVTYFLDTVVVEGVTWNLRDGVPMAGTDAKDMLSGFDINDVTGEAYDDLLWGYGGNDSLYGLAGDDVLDGGEGSDYLRGDDGNDALLGGADGDEIQGDGGSDTLDGGDGNDFIFTNAVSGIDRDVSIDGGAGDDYIEISNLLGGFVSGGDGNDQLRLIGIFDQNSGSARFSSIEELSLTSSFESHTLRGTTSDDVLDLGTLTATGKLFIYAEAGDDTIIGGSTNDTIYGGGGNDALGGGVGDDIILGEAGDNALTGGDGNDTLYGGSGVDTLSGGNGEDVLYGGGRDTLNGGTGNDYLVVGLIGGTIVGGRGTDRVRFNSSFDELSGSARFSGIELLDSSGGLNRIYGGAGNDVLDLTTLTARSVLSIVGKDGDDWITGGSTEDRIDGEAGDDRLNGGLGDDTLRGGQGIDTLKGGDGNDRIFSDEDGHDSVDGEDGDDYIEITGTLGGAIAGGDGIDTIRLDGRFDGASGSALFGGMEALAASEPDDPNALTGTAADDVLDLTTLTVAGSLSIHGGDGDDSIVGGTTMDSIYGGIGSDTLNGGLSNDYVTGEDDDDALGGGAGDDIVYGGAGIDTLNGGGGNDFLDGGSGADVLIGGVGVDTGSYVSATAGVVVSLAVDTAQNTGGAGTDRLTGVEQLVGSAYADRLTGGAGDNRLDGGAGNDVLDGGAGTDLLIGGAGIDDASYVSATKGVIVSLALLSAQNTSGGGIDQLEGIEQLIGSAYGDRLTGDGGTNRLVGSRGDDVLRGGAGADVLIGGPGADRFFFADGDLVEASSTLTDRITDFSIVDKDVIDLSALDAISGTVANDAFTLRADGQFTGVPGELTWRSLSDGNTYVIGDTNGDRRRDFSIRLDGAIALQSISFLA